MTFILTTLMSAIKYLLKKSLGILPTVYIKIVFLILLLWLYGIPGILKTLKRLIIRIRKRFIIRITRHFENFKEIDY